MTLTEKDVKGIKKVVSTGYNPNTSKTVLVELKDYKGLYVQYYKGWKMVFKSISVEEAEGLKLRHIKELEGKKAINWLRDNIRLVSSRGTYVRPSILVVAAKILENQSRTWNDTQQKTCYDCNGPSWSHSSWQEWRGEGEWSINPTLVGEMKNHLEKYHSISQELEW